MTSINVMAFNLGLVFRLAGSACKSLIQNYLSIINPLRDGV